MVLKLNAPVYFTYHIDDTTNPATAVYSDLYGAYIWLIFIRLFSFFFFFKQIHLAWFIQKGHISTNYSRNPRNLQLVSMKNKIKSTNYS